MLNTAGDPFYQRWKFGLLGLDHLFSPEDQHYVPRYGSKAEVLRHYLAFGRVRFIDDGVNWHMQVLEQQLPVECFRARWSADTRSAIHSNDGEHWRVVYTPAKLRTLLQG